MDRHDIARQTQVEQELLGHIMHVLRTSASWPVPGADASRKLSTLRFVSQSFQRHIEHLLALEEYDGYMDMVLHIAPWLGRATDALRAEHDTFRGSTRQIVRRLELLSATSTADLEKICGELLDLLGKVETHNSKEIALIQEALKRDEGGEG